MSDLLNDAKYLKYYHTSQESLLDKDVLKNKTFDKYCNKVTTAFVLPLGFQLWQISLVNNFEKAALYRKVRIFKAFTFFGVLAVAVYEKYELERHWSFINRFYPEPTELQKSLFRDAMLFKQSNF